MAIRPYVRYFNSSKYIEDLANGEICLALGWNGDVGQAALRAREAKNGNNIKYMIPKEGAVLFFDMLAIPKDAPHPKNAHLFIDYLLRPEVSARNSSTVHFASSNAAAYDLIDPVIYNDRGIFPAPETTDHLTANLPRSQAYTRLLNRMWTRVKSGQ
jgi:putrescine transport system substrate-binding protein